MEYLGVVFYMGRRGHLGREVHHVGGPTHVVERGLALQLVGHGHDVHRRLVHVERLDGGEYLLVARFVERLRPQHFRDHRESVLVYHQCTQHHPLHVGGLRLQVSVGRIDGGRGFAAVGHRPAAIVVFWHVVLIL